MEPEGIMFTAHITGKQVTNPSVHIPDIYPASYTGATRGGPGNPYADLLMRLNELGGISAPRDVQILIFRSSAGMIFTFNYSIKIKIHYGRLT